MAADLRNIAPGVERSSRSPTANASVEWPPGVQDYIPGYPFAAATVHIRRSFPGTIIRSLATATKQRPAIPVRPLYSTFEMRNTGPKLLAFIRPWYWRGPNQDILVVNGSEQVRPVGSSVTPATLPSAAQMAPRSRLTSTLRVPAYTAAAPSVRPTGSSTPHNRMGR